MPTASSGKRKKQQRQNNYFPSVHWLIIRSLWRSDIYLLCRVWNKLVSIGNNSHVCCIFVFALFCSLLCYHICSASGLKKRYKWGCYAFSSQEINLCEGEKKDIAAGDTLHLRCRKKTVQRTLHAASPADDWVGCRVGFIPAVRCLRGDYCLNVCRIIAASTSGQKNPPTSFEDAKLVIMCSYINQSKNQVHDLHSVATHAVYRTKRFAVERLLLKEGTSGRCVKFFGWALHGRDEIWWK